MQTFIRICLIVVMAWTASARAQLTIEITTEGSKQFPIAIVPLGDENALPQSVSRIVGADLARSGLFRLVDPAGVTPQPHEPGQIGYADWKAKSAEAIVIGTASPRPDGRFELRVKLMDVVKQTQMLTFSETVEASRLRNAAHRIADLIFENITGDRGIFATKIAYVAKGGTYTLKVADADGENEQTVLSSPEPIMSPSWSPDGTKIAYVSFELKKPVVVVQNLGNGSRKVVANFKGSNSAPAWSPDGKKLAVTLTKDNGSQLYLIDLDGNGSAVRLTSSTGIDTEPVFSPDGKWIAFTSDRGGGPQIYRIAAGGGDVQRVTFSGTYNVSAHYSSDGKKLVYISRNGGQFRVTLQELDSGQIQTLTDTTQDESPSFAPNGKTILYATQFKGRGVLSMVSSDGRVKQRLTTQSGDVREPAWGPL